MKELFVAVYSRWIATMGDIPLYNTEAVDDTVFPYGVVQIISNIEDMTGNFDDDDEEILLQFNLFSKEAKSTEINAIYKLLKNAFHKHDLVVDGYDTVSLVKEMSNLIRVEKVWQYNITFRLELSKK